MVRQITKDTIVIASQEQVSADLTADFDGDSVVLDLRDGIYYELNAVATSVWKLIQKPVAVETILNALLEEYDVGRDQCNADLLILLDDMARRGIIEIQNEPRDDIT